VSRKIDISTFGELVQVLDDLPVIVLNARRSRRLSQRGMATETGLSFSTICRIEQGGECSSISLRALLAWLDGPKEEER
jgi:ribosome-binding protein aMBF1 (putative translation factor)